MSNRKAVALNTASQIAGKIITSGTTFIISILIARMLGADGYGNFTKITTFVAFFYLFADFGLNPAYLELSEHKNAQHILLTIRTILGLSLMFVCVAILAFLPGTPTQGYTPFVKFGIIVYSTSIILQSLITTTNAFFQKHLRYDFASYALASGSLITLLIVAVLPYLHISGVLFSIIAMLIGTCMTTVVALFLAKKLIGTLSFSIDIPFIKKMLIIAAPLGLTLLCNVVYFHADSVILTLTRSTDDVGIYGFAYKLFEFPLVIPTFFMNAVFPLLLMSRKNNDTPAFFRQMKQSALILFSCSLVIFICGYVASPLIPFINADFQASILPFRILLISLPIFYMTSITMWVLVALKKRTQLLLIYFLSMVINIGGNVLLVPPYGYVAAAWITVVSEACVLLLSLVIIQKHFQNTQNVG